MDPRSALRERGRWTRASMLSLMAERPGISRSAIARQLGLTTQAVSVQAQELVEAGLASDEDGLRPTPQGIEMLHGDTEALIAAVQGLRAPVADIETLSAVAAAPIQSGQVVGLWMRNGDLMADPAHVGTSRGIAVAAAAHGDEVCVRNPQGVVELTPGTIHVIRVPEPDQGGLATVAMQARIPHTGLVASVGTGATILARRMGRLDMPFAGAEGALNAAQRGIDVRLYVSGDQVADALRVIEAGNRGPLRVTVSVEDAPKK